MKKLAAALIILTTPALSQEPTVVFGASETAPGVYDEYTVTQPENAPNPLGNPIVAPVAPQETNTTTPPTQTQEKPSKLLLTPNTVQQSNPQNPAPFSISPKQQQNQIENTLYEGGNRIYDIQSYPLKDIKTITEPNIDPTITTYPEY